MTHTLTGMISGSHSVTTDIALPAKRGRVTIILEDETVAESVPTECSKTLWKVMEQIWSGQNARGHVPPTVADVDQRIRDVREGW